MDNSAASRKDLEANGHVDDTPSEGSSEQLNPYQKRSRRMEYVYISIAVVLGAALIAVLVYYSVTNAQKDDPVAVSSTDMISTTTDYDDLFGNIGGEDGNGDSQGLDGLLPGDMTRAANRVPSARNIGQTATTESPGTTASTKEPTTRDFVILRGGNPALRSEAGGNVDNSDQGSNPAPENTAGNSTNTNQNGEGEAGGNVDNSDQGEGEAGGNVDNSDQGEGETGGNVDNNGQGEGETGGSVDNNGQGEGETGGNVDNNGQGRDDFILVRSNRQIVPDNNAISTTTTANEGGGEADTVGDNSDNSATN